MEVMVPKMALKSPDFHFSSYATAPSSPKPFGVSNPDEFFYCYTSAPTSPTRASTIYSYLSSNIDVWEKPMMSPKYGNEFDFAFGQGERGRHEELISTADELFDKGRIKPLKPPPAPRTRGGETLKEGGRESAPLSSLIASSGSRRESRSQSPMRGEGGFRKIPHSSVSTSASASMPSVKSSGSKKWRLKDFLLFRSASEGRATGRGIKDTLGRYTLLSTSFNKKRVEAEAKSGSFKSAHELHYTANRAASEEQKKKTPLPYHRNTLFGCLHFNPAVRSVARGFNTNSFNRGR